MFAFLRNSLVRFVSLVVLSIGANGGALKRANFSVMVGGFSRYLASISRQTSFLGLNNARQLMGFKFLKYFPYMMNSSLIVEEFC